MKAIAPVARCPIFFALNPVMIAVERAAATDVARSSLTFFSNAAP
jgi:hypothetical protein